MGRMALLTALGLLVALAGCGRTGRWEFTSTEQDSGGLDTIIPGPDLKLNPDLKPPRDLKRKPDLKPKPDMKRLPGWAVSTGIGGVIRLAVRPGGEVYLLTHGYSPSPRERVLTLSAAGKKSWSLAAGGSGRLYFKDIAAAAGAVCLTGYTSSKGVTFAKRAIPGDRFMVAGLTTAGALRWLHHHDSKANGLPKRLNGVAVNSAGACQATGTFSGKVSLGGATFTSATNADVFVYSLGTGGKAAWARAPGGLMADASSSAAALPGGGVAITGSFGYKATFGKTTISTTGHEKDAFVARYDAKGNLKWVVALGGPNLDEGLSIAADAGGGVTVLGKHDGDTSVGTVSIKGGGQFLVRFNSAGKMKWALPVSGGMEQIASDSRGNIYLVPWQQYSTNKVFIGPLKLKPPATAGIRWAALVRVSPGGKPALVKEVTTSTATSFGLSAVAVGGGDRLHVGGSFRGTLKLGKATLKSSGDRTHGFVWKLD